MPASALMNVMLAAARKAGRSLARDFGEVEQLQVSLKGPANFVSAADRRAEEILLAELSHGRPGYGFLMEERAAFLQDGMKVNVESHEGRPIGVSLPDQVTLKVVEADPVVKGQTAASSYKPAKLENGVRIMVPPFVEAGERVVVDTNELTYVRRAE